jgi:hypothetical protein
MTNCHDDSRRRLVRARPELIGLDYLEVDQSLPTLTVYFLGRAPGELGPENWLIEGGRRIRDIRVLESELHPAEDIEEDDRVVLTLDRRGDFSSYTLRLLGVEPVDPRYDRISFSFMLDCPADLDCAPIDACPPPQHPAPEISYLAKDYASFRRLIYDRLALIMPAWQERHVPDLGVALVELLAYTGDYLSYYQDAVATEAYLDTARRRVSVRRHARLVDFLLHEGANARAVVHVGVNTPIVLEPNDLMFFTGLRDWLPQVGLLVMLDQLRDLPMAAYEIFEPARPEPIALDPRHNELRIYTWGQRECCLPPGATSATLVYAWSPPAPSDVEDSPKGAAQRAAQRAATPSATAEPQVALRPGDLLIFEEVLGPRTGASADADPTRRHLVRLTSVSPIRDTVEDPPIDLLEIEWAAADALPFDICISAIGPAPECVYLEPISVARGNLVLVDHGRRYGPEPLADVELDTARVVCICEGHVGELETTARRYRPALPRTPIVFRREPPASGPAAQLMNNPPRGALPMVSLRALPPAPGGGEPLFTEGDLADPTLLAHSLGGVETGRLGALRRRLPAALIARLDALDPGAEPSPPLLGELRSALETLIEHWDARLDLLASSATGRHFVVEAESDGRAKLRFGDGDVGRRPAAGMRFLATYRIGGGPAGNVGADVITHLALRTGPTPDLQVIRNPLPAQGGASPEPLAEARLLAPALFHSELQRAIVPADYARIVERDFAGQVQRAAASLSWIGSWYEVLVAVDPVGGEADMRLLEAIGAHLERYRRIGHTLQVRQANRVPLDIELSVCVLPSFLRGHVRAALADLFSSRVLPDGRRGLFHPDNLTFGEGVAAARLVAAAHKVPGVESARVTRLQRRFEEPRDELERGIVPLGPLEVAQVDNDPSFPEHGRIELKLEGGR